MSETRFFICNYEILSPLIFILKSAGITNRFFGTHWDQLYLETKGTLLRVEVKQSMNWHKSTFTQTLFYKDSPLCFTHVRKATREAMFSDRAIKPDKNITLLYPAVKLPKNLVQEKNPIEPSETEIIFYAGITPPYSLEMDHLRYLGITNENLFLKEGSWFIKLPMLSHFTVVNKNCMLYRGLEVARTYKHEWSKSTSLNIDVNNIATALGKNDNLIYFPYYWGYGVNFYNFYTSFSGTPEAFVTLVERSYIIRSYGLTPSYTPDKSLKVVALEDAKFEFFIKALNSQKELQELSVSEWEISKKNLLRLLKVLNSIASFKKLNLNIVIDDFHENDLVFINELEALLSTLKYEILIIDLKNNNNKLKTSFKMTEFNWLKKIENSYLNLLVEDLTPYLKLLLFKNKYQNVTECAQESKPHLKRI